MPIIAKDVLARAQIVLQDAGAKRWPLLDLLAWLNDGLRDIAFYKPTALSETKVVDLVKGTLQELADGEQIMRAHRNIISEEGVTPRVAGLVVTPIPREILDAHMPEWHMETFQAPFQRAVCHVVTDQFNPRIFYVYPGNNGSGRIELTVSVTPETIPDPAGGAGAALAAYTQEIPINITYLSVLVDYVLYRSFSMDVQYAGAADRAVAHYQNFQNALGIKQQIEGATSPSQAQAAS